ncbi:hypothetical protein [Chitinimonas sp. BJYL2]|uniref:hypothetical protein n=1 Tax=Chitinimonas sp. BJYL2 TaxID=2976696 RepID=UPI0022B3A9B8|nr:hypothetical protein [Chitinimonas sp. BJYL2]
MWSGNKLIDSGVSMQERVRRHYAPLEVAPVQPLHSLPAGTTPQAETTAAAGWQAVWSDALARTGVLAEAEAAIYRREAALAQRELALRQRERALQDKAREQAESLLWQPTIRALSR